MHGPGEWLNRQWKRFPPLVWTVLIGTLVLRTAFLMIWPFLAVMLAREFHLSPTAIGTILTTAFLSSAFVGFYAGHVSDRCGRLPVMMAGVAGAVVAYATLAMAGSVAAYTAGAFLVGSSRAVLEPPSKALIADCLEHQPTRDLAFHVRYFLINVGAAVGPLLGLVFGLSAQQQTFWITAIVHACFGIVVVVMIRRSAAAASARGTTVTTLGDVLGILRNDRAFVLLLAAMTLTLLAYAQQESTLIQYVTIEGGARTIALVTTLLVTNAMTVVLFQFPLLRVLAGVDPFVRTYLGLTFFGVAFLCYPLLPVTTLMPWIVVTWLLSVGEAVLFPTLQIQVDRLAPAHMKGSYFGAAGLSGIGFGLGPIVGGVLLQHTGAATFYFTALAVALAALACRTARRHADARDQSRSYSALMTAGE